MAKYHINPATGNPNICTATKRCRFGDEATHYPTEANARQAYELSMGPGAQAAKEAQQALEAANAPDDAAYNAMVGYGHEASPDADFETLLDTLTEEDIIHGIDNVGVTASNKDQKKYGFKGIMGDIRRTSKQEALYQRKLRGMVASDPELRRQAFHQAQLQAKQKVWARAFDRKLPINPIVDAHFKAIWAGKENGQSHENALEAAQRIQKTDDDFRDGRISAAKIVGGGLINPSAIAREYIDRRHNEISRSLATEGRSDSVNVRNAIYVAMQRGLPTSTPGF